jgi:hypothetical protein
MGLPAAATEGRTRTARRRGGRCHLLILAILAAKGALRSATLAKLANQAGGGAGLSLT